MNNPLNYETMPAIWRNWAMNRIRDQAIEHDLREAGIMFETRESFPTVSVLNWDFVTFDNGEGK